MSLDWQRPSRPSRHPAD